MSRAREAKAGTGERMRVSRRLVTVFCGVAIGVSVFAGPAHAEFESSKCKALGKAWKKSHPHATLAQKQAEAEKLATSHSCNYSVNPKAL
jgi:hypothetical protein